MAVAGRRQGWWAVVIGRRRRRRRRRDRSPVPPALAALPVEEARHGARPRRARWRGGMWGWRRPGRPHPGRGRSEEHTSELQSLMRTSYAVFCLKKKISTSISMEADRDRTRMKPIHIYSAITPYSDYITNTHTT